MRVSLTFVNPRKGRLGSIERHQHSFIVPLAFLTDHAGATAVRQEGPRARLRRSRARCRISRHIDAHHYIHYLETRVNNYKHLLPLSLHDGRKPQYVSRSSLSRPLMKRTLSKAPGSTRIFRASSTSSLPRRWARPCGSSYSTEHGTSHCFMSPYGYSCYDTERTVLNFWCVLCFSTPARPLTSCAGSQASMGGT